MSKTCLRKTNSKVKFVQVYWFTESISGLIKKTQRKKRFKTVYSESRIEKYFMESFFKHGSWIQKSCSQFYL